MHPLTTTDRQGGWSILPKDTSTEMNGWIFLESLRNSKSNTSWCILKPKKSSDRGWTTIRTEPPSSVQREMFRPLYMRLNKLSTDARLRLYIQDKTQLSTYNSRIKETLSRTKMIIIWTEKTDGLWGVKALKIIPVQKDWVSWSRCGAVHCGTLHSKDTCCEC